MDIQIAPDMPFPVECLVFEEDTFLVMSAPLIARESRHDIDELVQRMSEFKPPAPGEVIVKGQQYLAVVHDLEQTPTCVESSVEAALLELGRLFEAAGVKAVGMEPLGCKHGPFEHDWLIDRVQALWSASGVRRVWVKSD